MTLYEELNLPQSATGVKNLKRSEEHHRIFVGQKKFLN